MKIFSVRNLTRVLLFFLLAFFSGLALAAGEPWLPGLNKIVSAVTGTTGTAVSVAAVAIQGYRLFKGNTSLDSFLLVVLGVLLIRFAAESVTWLITP